MMVMRCHSMTLRYGSVTRKTRALMANTFSVNMMLLPSINPPEYSGYAHAAVEEGVCMFETASNNHQCQERLRKCPVAKI